MLTLIPRKAVGSSHYGGAGNGYAEPKKAKECEELHLRADNKAFNVDVLVLGDLQVYGAGPTLAGFAYVAFYLVVLSGRRSIVA